MKNISIVTNVGTHDFIIPLDYKNEFLTDFQINEDQIINFSRSHFYAVTEKIFGTLDSNEELFKKYKDKRDIFFPIFNSYIRKLQDNYKDIYVEVLLIYTKQTSFDIGYHNQDTKYCSKLIELFFKDKNIKFEFLELNFNPSNYNLAYENMSKDDIVNKISNINRKKDFNFVCPTSGAPALMFALIMVSINISEKIRFMYSSKGEYGQQAIFIEFKNIMKKHFLASYVKEIGERNSILDYSVLEEFFAITGNTEKKVISSFLNEFYNNRYNSALNKLNDFENYSISLRIRDYDKFKDMLQNWEITDNKILILFYIIEYLFIKQNFTELIIKINCLLELLTIRLNMKYFNLNADNIKYERTQEKILEKNQQLNMSFLKLTKSKNCENYKQLKDIGIKPWEGNNWDYKRTNHANLLINIFFKKEENCQKQSIESFFEKHNSVYNIVNEYRNKLAHTIVDVEKVKLDKDIIIKSLKDIYQIVYDKKIQNIIGQIEGLLKI